MEQSIYERLGDDNLQMLVDQFYDRVQKNEIISPLFKGEFDEIKRKQYMFLSQFLGGPSRYSEEFGHPKMRMRHLPHKITEEARDEWLMCMNQAIQTLPIDENFKEVLYQCFPKVANHMVNSR